MNWFRFYAEFRSDPKVLSMSDAMQIRLVRLLCLKAECSLDGLTDEMVALALRIKVSTLDSVRFEFESRGFISPGSWEPRNWDERQYKSDCSTERVKRFRNVSRNGSETPRGRRRPRSEQNRTEQKDPLTPPTGETGGGFDPDASAPNTFRPHGDPDLRKVAEKAERLFPLLEIGSRLSALTEHWPVDWIDAALDAAAMSKPADKMNLGYIKGILQRYGTAGPPPPPLRMSPQYGAPPPRERCSPEEIEKRERERTKKLYGHMEARRA
jgi:hypothetical protein